jgi:peptidoglycan/LPS O-acetylase OafA/YrhL
MKESVGGPVRAEASPYSRHLPALDGVRGLAILLVMGSHLFPGTPHTLPERMARSLLAFGATGVDLFFVLSGFLITGILYDSLQEERFFRKFYARRALRILPLYYGVIAVYAVVGMVQHLSSHGELLSLTCYLQNTSLIAPPIFYYSGPLFLPLGHFWSLAIEEQFYLVWPLLVFLLRTRTRLLILCAGLILLCPILRFLAWNHGVPFPEVHGNTLYRADSLVIGGALSLLLRSRWHDRVISTAGWLFLSIPLLFFSSFELPRLLIRPQAMFAVATSSDSLLALGYAGLLVLALGSSATRSLFSVKPMRFLGKYSYGLYVLHVILFSYLEVPLRNALSRIHVGRGLSVVIVGVVGFTASILAAVLSYQLYERHFLKLKRFFDYRRSDSGAAGASAQSASSSRDRTSASPALHRG